MNFTNTYLYKLQSLTNELNKAFDRTLQTHADTTLSQLMLLMAISTHTRINQRNIARYLSISPAAVNRQADIAKLRGWVKIIDSETRGELLQLTAEGESSMHRSVSALEQHVFQIFDDHNRSFNLMGHIDLLLHNVKEVRDKQKHTAKQALKCTINHTKENSHANT